MRPRDWGTDPSRPNLAEREAMEKLRIVRRGATRTKLAVAILPLAVMLLRPAQAKAQVLTLGAVAGAASTVWTLLNDFYNAYEASNAWKDPVATQSIVDQAVAEIQNTIIFVDATDTIQQVQLCNCRL